MVVRGAMRSSLDAQFANMNKNQQSAFGGLQQGLNRQIQGVDTPISPAPGINNLGPIRPNVFGTENIS